MDSATAPINAPNTTKIPEAVMIVNRTAISTEETKTPKMEINKLTKSRTPINSANP
jgi:hypothetical protein